MAIDLNLETISSGFNTSKINRNFQAIDQALQNAVSRSGESPNQMNADFDMNSNDILNAGTINADTVTVDGVPLVPGDVSVDPDSLVPVGGTDGQVLTKQSSTDYDVAWEDVEAISSAPLLVTSRTALKAVDTNEFTVVYLSEGKRSGTFVFLLGDYSAQVTADTEEGAYIAANAVATTIGAWVRVYTSLNILWFGADPNFLVDSAPAIKAVRGILEVSGAYRGGEIFIPKGRYLVNSTIAFTANAQVHNIWIKGEGPNNTVLDFSNQIASTDGITFDPGTHFGVEGITITGSKRNGLSINPGVTVGSGTYSQQFVLRNLRVQQSTSSGIHLINAFMGELSDIWSTANGANGFQLSGFHTSLTITRCWASGNALAGASAGWAINGVTYSSFINCGSDANTWGYAVSNTTGTSFINCGAESNTRDAWILQSSTASATGIPAVAQDISGLSFIDCFAIQNGQTPLFYGAFINALTADSRPISFKVIGGKSAVFTAGDYAFVLQGTSGTVTYSIWNHSTDGNTLTSGTTVQDNVVTTNGTQILSNKTLVTPVITTSVAINGTAATNRKLALTTAGVERWTWSANATAEGGSNSGSDLRMFAVDDAGVAIGAFLQGVRANLLMTVGGSLSRGSPVTKTADFTVGISENWLINNKSGSTCTVTLPAAATFPGREIHFKNSQAQTVVSASSNVVPRVTAAAGTAILASGSGQWCTMVSDGTNWVIMQGS